MTGISYHDRLRRARIDAGLSQLELALEAGISTSTISAVEQGTRDLTAPKLFAWAQVCKVSLDAIAGPVERPAADPSAVELDLEAIA